MWGNNGKGGRVAIDTLVGRNTTITGDVHFSGGLHIDGRIEGNVQCDADVRSHLSLSQHGRVDGEIRVVDIEVDGTVTGNVYAAGRIEIGAHARIDGNVYYNILQMASGAAVNGQLLHRPGDREPARLTADVVTTEESLEGA
jgi:cytoskeletal protein CcmA (bactofilin family)